MKIVKRFWELNMGIRKTPLKRENEDWNMFHLYIFSLHIRHRTIIHLLLNFLNKNVKNISIKKLKKKDCVGTRGLVP